MTLCPARLWLAAAAAWGATAAADAAGAGEDVYTAVLGVALILSLAAVQSVAITRRLDRQYTAMMQAAIRLRTSGPLQAVPGERESVVVSLRGTAHSSRGATGG